MYILMGIWWVSVFVIVWAMIGYPISLLVLDKCINRENVKNTSYEPTVTIMIVAHNEEKIIRDKLNNLLTIDYPKDKLEILVASDFCTDRTDEFVESFALEHPEFHIRIHKSANRLGKTNAQNEAQELCCTEILVMTDANAMFEPDAVRELVSYFTSPDIAYVSGQLRYVNILSNNTANSEGLYWKLDLMCRDIESRFQTITAGNGAIYAVRNEYYKRIPPIECHDSSFPILYALEKKRAIYNPKAIAYEKAGEMNDDEYKRKVRMNRIVIKGICPNIKIFNCFSYHWFSYFYFGHRTCRYLLWLSHFLVLILSIPLAILGNGFWKSILVLQVMFYLIAAVGWSTNCNNRLVKMTAYYCMTVLAQWKGVINVVTGQAKPIWEKAESTR